MKTHKNLFLVSLFVVLGFCACSKSNGQQLQHVSAEAFQEAILNESDAVLIDVRTAQEFEAGHLEGAINWDVHDPAFVEKIKTLNKEKTIYVYCHSGARSTKAGNLMVQNGINSVVNMTGGIMAWKSKSLPTTR